MKMDVSNVFDKGTLLCCVYIFNFRIGWDGRKCDRQDVV